MTSPDPVPHAGSPRADGSEPSNSALVHRIVEFERILADRLATRVTALPFGIARICPDMPRYYDASGVEVTAPVTGDELLRTTESVFADAGLRHRRIHTTVAEVASAVGPTLINRGWSLDRLVYMAHDRRLSAAVASQGYATVDIETWAPAARAFAADQKWMRDPPVIADTVAHERRLAARIDVRFILTDDATAGCHMYRLGDVAQIENIYVLSHARGNGLGRTLLAGALHECRDADLVFLVAEAGGWQRQWYARAGFAVVAPGWNWLRRPAVNA
jgi:GNAT superfamily N-acetyltransferase